MNMEDIEQLRQQIKKLRAKILLYESDNNAKLFYALQRKAGEMADVLNNNPLDEIDLNDSSKRFDRIKAMYEGAAELAVAIKTVGQAANVTGDEEKDVARIVARISVTPESISDVLNNR